MSLFKIFVEGKDDKKFIEDYSKHLTINSENLEVISTGGWTMLHNVENEFKKNTFNSGINIIIFDADSDFKKRIEEIRIEINRLKLVTELFLIPTNLNSGNLESILLTIANPLYKSIFSCFENYNVCLGNSDANYRLSPEKDKVYAYLQALNSEANVENRNYLDQKLWNLNHNFLDNLKAFMIEKISSN